MLGKYYDKRKKTAGLDGRFLAGLVVLHLNGIEFFISDGNQGVGVPLDLDLLLPRTRSCIAFDARNASRRTRMITLLALRREQSFFSAVSCSRR